MESASAPFFERQFTPAEVELHADKAVKISRASGYGAVRGGIAKNVKRTPIHRLYLHTHDGKSHFPRLVPFPALLTEPEYFYNHEETGARRFKRPFFALYSLDGTDRVNPFSLDSQMRKDARRDLHNSAGGGSLRMVYLQAYRAEMERRLSETLEGRIAPLLETIRSAVRVLLLEAPASKRCPPPEEVTKKMLSRASILGNHRHLNKLHGLGPTNPVLESQVEETWGEASPLAELYWWARRVWLQLAHEGYTKHTVPRIRAMGEAHEIDADLVEYQLTAFHLFGLRLRSALRDAFATAVNGDAADDLLREEFGSPTTPTPKSPWTERGRRYLRAVAQLEGKPFPNKTSYFSMIADLAHEPEGGRTVSQSAPRRAFERAGFFASGQTLDDFRPNLEREARRVLSQD